jgi:hypothetical protein
MVQETRHVFPKNRHVLAITRHVFPINHHDFQITRRLTFHLSLFTFHFYWVRRVLAISFLRARVDG